MNIHRNLYICVALCVTLFLMAGCGETVVLSGDTSGSTSVITAESDDITETSQAQSDAETTTEATTIYIFVCGAVANEGVYELDANARVNDALEAAGGFADEADRDALNLAATLTDGQRLYFPTEEEVANGDWEDTSASSVASSETAASSSDGKVNINTATKDELTTLSGIGDTRAESIISYRESNGSFSSIEDIKNVSGIGDSLYDKIKDYITVS